MLATQPAAATNPSKMPHLLSPITIWLMPDSMTFWCSKGTPVASTSFCLISSLLEEASMSMVTSGPQDRWGVMIFTCSGMVGAPRRVGSSRCELYGK